MPLSSFLYNPTDIFEGCEDIVPLPCLQVDSVLAGARLPDLRVDGNNPATT